MQQKILPKVQEKISNSYTAICNETKNAIAKAFAAPAPINVIEGHDIVVEGVNGNNNDSAIIAELLETIKQKDIQISKLSSELLDTKNEIIKLLKNK